MRCPHCDNPIDVKDIVCPTCNKDIRPPSRQVPTQPAAVEKPVATIRRNAGGFTVFLLLISVLIGIAGFFTLSSATLGVGLIGLACLFAIWGRISQAGDYGG